MFEITGLMACDANGVIGYKGGLPWHNEDETRHFRKMVAGQIIVMGRKTFESMPQNSATDSTKIIFSREVKENKPSITFVSSLKDFISLKLDAHKKVFMIGGAEIANLFLQNGLISEFILTVMNKSYEGDAFLDLSLFNGWSEELINEHNDYKIYKLVKS